MPTITDQAVGRRPNATTTFADDPLALLSKQQVAALLGINVYSVDRMRKPDAATYDPTFPPPIWIGRSTARWKRVDIAAWLASRPHGGLSPDWQQHPRARPTAAQRAAQAATAPAPAPSRIIRRRRRTASRS
jgi:predicted DNA-binding transcriptional regulator AlpA